MNNIYGNKIEKVKEKYRDFEQKKMYKTELKHEKG